jgi:hypothetical protein
LLDRLSHHANILRLTRTITGSNAPAVGTVVCEMLQNRVTAEPGDSETGEVLPD